MPEITKALYLTDRRKWRQWLTKNYQTAPDVWLVFPNKASGKPRLSYNDAVEEALCFGWIDSIVKKYDEDSVAQRFSPRKNNGYFSQPNIERLRHMAAQGLVLPQVLKIAKPFLDAEFVFPPDIMKAIHKNAAAYKTFMASSPSYQRIRVAYIEIARSRPEDFNKRLANFVKALEQGKTLGFGGIDARYS